jgi:UDP-N-acetyl-D-mannosaminuronic acid transferase (WecB/TagA/CpsF family)
LISKKSIENHQRKLILTFKKLENKCTKKNINYLESLYYFNNIKMVNDINSFIHKKKNFVLSGLNLAFLGSYFSNKVIFYKNLYHWPDGYLPLIVSKSLNKFEKIAGRNLIRNLKLTKKIKYVHIFGNLNLNQKKIIRNLLKKKIVHTKLPYGSAGKLAQKCGKLKKNILYILTLPTPKQEIVAEILSIKNQTYKILLLGGAINILTGVEREVPHKIRYFEFLWRLRFESVKRFNRLLFTSISFIFNYVFRKKHRRLLG